MSKYKVMVDFGQDGFSGTYSLIGAMRVIRQYASQARITVRKSKDSNVKR